MLPIGRRELRWIAGAMCLASGAAGWAEGAPDGNSGSVLVAAITPPPPIEVLSPIPEPGQYVYRYEMQYSSYQATASALKPADFYAAPLGASARPVAVRPQTGLSPSVPQEAQPQRAGQTFDAVAPSASLIDLFQFTDDGTGTSTHPQRRLALLIDDWRVSASAHIPLTHAHDAGASVFVKRGF